MKKQLVLLNTFLFLFSVFICDTAIAADEAVNISSADLGERLLIVRSGDATVYRDVEKGFRQFVARKITQLLDTQSISLEERSTLTKLFDRKNPLRFDLIITIGTKAAHDILKLNPSDPVLSVFIPRDAYHTILNEVKQPLNSTLRSAIYLDQPDERLVLLASELLKQNKRRRNDISLFGKTSKSTLIKARNCGGSDVDAFMRKVSFYPQLNSVNELKDALRHSDAIVATAELSKQSPNAIKWMLYMAYQRNVPVVGYSRAFVDAGAIAAVYSKPAQIGRQAAEVFIKQRRFLQKSGNRSLPALMYPAYFHVSINESVAEALSMQALNAEFLENILLESPLNCKEDYLPLDDGTQQRLTRR